jgi:general secretion pathway protein M
MRAAGTIRERGSLPSRAAALVLLGLVVALLYAGLIAPYRDYVAALDDRLDAKASILDRMRSLTRQPAAPDDPATAATLDALLLPDLSDAQAVGQLQDRLKEFAAAGGVDLQGVQVLPPIETATLSRLAVRLRGAADMAALNRFLHAVESTRPVLLIDNLRIQSRAPRGAPSPASAVLDIQLDVIGFKALAAS